VESLKVSANKHSLVRRCRGCRKCYSLPLPSWATATLAGIRAACALYGMGICNATGNLSNVISAVQADSYARWAFNHTHLWIDAVFAHVYQKEEALYYARASALPRMVPAEEGLSDAEQAMVLGPNNWSHDPSQ